MNLIAYALTKIRTPKGALGQMSSHFRRPSNTSNMVNGPKHC